MKTKIKNNLWLVIILAASYLTCVSFQIAYAADIPAVSLTILCTNTDLKVGDEIPIEFLISNRGTGDYTFNRSRDSGIEMPEFNLTAKTESGESVRDPRVGSKHIIETGDLFETIVLHPGESTTRILPLNRWALVKEPGRYMITGTFLGFRYRGTPDQPVNSAPISVTVLPRTDKEMDDYIDSLIHQLAALPSLTMRIQRFDRNDALVKKLMFTCSPRIASALIENIYKPGIIGFWEGIALLDYVPHTPEIRKAIIEAVTKQGLAGGTSFLLNQYDFSKQEMKPVIEQLLASDNQHDWDEGTFLAEKYGDDAFTARLIFIATNSGDYNVKFGALNSLALNRTDEGVKTLKGFLDDPDEKIWVHLANALINGHEHGTLRSEDFTAKDLKPFIERMLASAPDVNNGKTLIKLFGLKPEDFDAKYQ